VEEIMKETKRKTFKFYRSYYDVFNELDSDSDKLEFITAILDKQFLGIEPKLKGITKFAYISQQHSINKQIKGWQDATGQELTGPYTHPLGGPSEDPMPHPPMQVKEKEQEKEEVKEKEFDLFFDYYDKRVNKIASKKLFLKLSETKKDLIRNHLPLYLDSTPDKQFRKSPDVYLRNECWNDEVIKPTKTTQDNGTRL
jgi:hypothetical protein